MVLYELASAIINDLFGGNVIPPSNRSLISIEQIQDEILSERQALIRELYLKNLLSEHDLYTSINCIEVDCKDINKCPCGGIAGETTKHFEIPPVVDGLGTDAISFIGSTDRTVPFKIYYSAQGVEYQKYKRRNSNKPYVFIDKTPNENGLYDCWLFNAPLVKYITVVAIFKNPLDLKKYGCCQGTDYSDMGSLSSDLMSRILQRKASLYRTPSVPASQTIV